MCIVYAVDDEDSIERVSTLVYLTAKIQTDPPKQSPPTSHLILRTVTFNPSHLFLAYLSMLRVSFWFIHILFRKVSMYNIYCDVRYVWTSEMSNLRKNMCTLWGAQF